MPSTGQTHSVMYSRGMNGIGNDGFLLRRGMDIPCMGLLRHSERYTGNHGRFVLFGLATLPAYHRRDKYTMMYPPACPTFRSIVP